MSEVFGSPEELRNFAIITISTLFLFTVWILFRTKMRGASLLPSATAPNEFTWTTIFLSLWYFGGMVLDGWAHTHGQVDVSFFTPWHAIFYSGFIAYAGFIVWTLKRLHEGPLVFSKAGLTSFLQGMPKGYGTAVAGMVLFAFAGAGDFLWHWIFGIEGGLDILLSTTHLMLAAGMAIAVLAPFWAAWHNPHPQEDTFKGQIPAVTSLAISMSVLTFFTKYAHPLNLNLSEICQGHGSVISGPNCPTTLRSHGGVVTAIYDTTGLQLGVISMEIQAFITVGMVLLFMRRWKPARGTMLLLFGLNGIAVSFLAPGDLIEVPLRIILHLVMGLICEILVAKIKPELGGLHLRSFSFLLPFIVMLFWWIAISYFYGFAIETEGLEVRFQPLGWTVHGTFGAFFLAGCTGLLTSLFMYPPETPAIEVDA